MSHIYCKHETCIQGILIITVRLLILILVYIAGFHLTSWRPCWCTHIKRILIISFVRDTSMAATSIVFCVSWDCVKTKNSRVWPIPEIRAYILLPSDRVADTRYSCQKTYTYSYSNLKRNRTSKNLNAFVKRMSQKTSSTTETTNSSGAKNKYRQQVQGHACIGHYPSTLP